MVRWHKKHFVWKYAIWAAIGTVSIFFLVLFLMPSYVGNSGLRDLGAAIAYARRMPENPAMDNTNLVRPDFTTFYDSQLSGWLTKKWKSILNAFRLKGTDDWSAGYFSELLCDSLQRMSKDSFENKFIAKMAPKPGAQYVIWGDIYGAYHSVVRCLQHLKKMEILSDDFSIIAPDTYFVFMGDVISRSSYGMETLSLLLRLMQKNQDKVIYLRGNHEDTKYWHAFGLKEQIKQLAAELSPDDLITKVDAVFMQLPLALYLKIPNETAEFVRISHYGFQESKALKETQYAHFLLSEQKLLVDNHLISKDVIHASALKIAALMRSEKKRDTFQTMSGLRLLPPERGTTAWTLFSAPTPVSQQGLKFYHDAFALLKVTEHKERWPITLYSQDVRKMDGFKAMTYQFFTGSEMTEEALATASITPIKKEVVSVPIQTSGTVEKQDMHMTSAQNSHLIAPAHTIVQPAPGAPAKAHVLVPLRLQPVKLLPVSQ